MNVPLVHVVDDDSHLRQAIARLLRSHGLNAETYESARDFLNRRPAPGVGCLILDISMPGMNGLELQELLAQARLSLGVVFVTGKADIAASVKAMKAGAVDFITKPFEDSQLLDAVNRALEKSKKMHASEEEIDKCWNAFKSLTPRERQVCLSVARGLLNKQVGGELGIQEKTIKLHRSNMMRKLDVGSLADLVRLVETLKHSGRLESVVRSVHSVDKALFYS